MVQRPFVPFHILPLWKNKKGGRVFYKIATKHYENTHKMKSKWERELQLTIDEKSWISIFSLTYFSVNNNILIWFQLKLSYRILGTKEYLNKINVNNNSDCNHCQQRETILHMFVECDRVIDFLA